MAPLGKTVAAVMQPSYLGWAGYFALLDKADVFILDDQAQYVSKSWHNRNRIRTRDGHTAWLTVAVHGHRAPLNTIQIDNSQGWQGKQYRTLEAAYSHTPGWDKVKVIAGMIKTGRWDDLTVLTSMLIRQTSRQIGITTPIALASGLGPTREGMADRITDLCHAVHADVLLNTPTAKQYLDDTMLDDIHIEWFDYALLPYPQGAHEWQPYLSVVDLIAHTADNALTVIRGNPTGNLHSDT